jgi:hypothetical protein
MAPHFKESATLSRENPMPRIGLVHVKIDPGDIAPDLRPGLEGAIVNLHVASTNSRGSPGSIPIE